MAFIRPAYHSGTGFHFSTAYWRINNFSEVGKLTTNVVFYAYPSKDGYVAGTQAPIDSHQVDISSSELTGEGSYRELIYNWCAINEPFFANATRDDDEPVE